VLTGTGSGPTHQLVGGILTEHLGLDVTELSGPARLAEDLGLDSIGLTEALLALEDELSISIPEPVQAQLLTFDDLVTAVASRLGPP
jgi:acyl carrier protein